MTRITTSPARVYRERVSPMRVLTPSARIYRRDVSSPVRVVTSPARIVSIRVRPSVLSREFDRIDRKYRSSPIGVNDTEEYLNSAYSMVRFQQSEKSKNMSMKKYFRTSAMKLAISVEQQRDWAVKSANQFIAHKASLVTDVLQACSQLTAGWFLNAFSFKILSPKLLISCRFDPDLIDKYGNKLIDNEFYVNKNILRPTRKTRDQIEILSKIKYPDPPRRYTGEWKD